MIPIPTLLTLIFVVLKLCHVIDWSWWLVLCPALLPFLVYLVIYTLIAYNAIKVRAAWAEMNRTERLFFWARNEDVCNKLGLKP